MSKPGEKLLEAAAPRILSELVKMIMVELAPDPAKFIERIVPVKLPELPKPPLEQLAAKLADALTAGVEPKKALETLRKVKKLLEEYGVE